MKEDNNIVYVIGHKNPDTDTVVSAIVYAALKRKEGIECKAAVAGRINNETRYVLEHFNVAIPEILSSAEGKNVILVDHSNFAQAADGTEKANIAGIVDHHREGDIRTVPSGFTIRRELGAAATLVYLSCLEEGFEMGKQTAALLLAAILSDTRGLVSPVTTETDREACNVLSDIAGVNNLQGFYADLLKHAVSYDNMTSEEIFLSDYKEYERNGIITGIACVYAQEDGFEKMCAEMKKIMNEKSGKNNHTCIVMIYEPYRYETALLFSDAGMERIAEKTFGKAENGRISVPRTLSRKGEIVPMFLGER